MKKPPIMDAEMQELCNRVVEIWMLQTSPADLEKYLVDKLDASLQETVARIVGDVVRSYCQTGDVERAVAGAVRARATAQALPKLTPRQLEILRWSKAGKSADEVAHILGVSRTTISFHVSRILAKYGCDSKAHAVVKAIEAGVI